MTRLITAIEPQKRDPKRVNLYLDGNFAFGMTAVLAAWLKVGQELNEEKVASLMKDETAESAYSKALHFIGFKPRSVSEVRQRLEKAEFPDEVVEETLQRLLNNRLLDDEQFARNWIANRQDLHPRSQGVLRIELRRKGIQDETIQAYLEETTDDETLANQAAKKVLHRFENLDWQVFRKKMFNHLASRGFRYATIQPVVAQVWEKLHPGEGNPNFNDNED